MLRWSCDKKEKNIIEAIRWKKDVKIRGRGAQLLIAALGHDLYRGASCSSWKLFRQLLTFFHFPKPLRDRLWSVRETFWRLRDLIFHRFFLSMSMHCPDVCNTTEPHFLLAAVGPPGGSSIRRPPKVCRAC